MIVEIPEDFFNNVDKDELTQKLEQRRNQNWKLEDALTNLKNVKIETEDERKNRLKKNKEKFEKTLGKTFKIPHLGRN